MTTGRRIRTAALVATLAAVALLVVLAPGAQADHCDNNIGGLPACQPNHVVVDNWPASSEVEVNNFPASYPVSPSGEDCDPNAGLYPRSDGAPSGCQEHVLVHVENEWQPVALLAVVLNLVLLGAIAIAQFRP